jgi:hypothetical protein
MARTTRSGCWTDADEAGSNFLQKVMGNAARLRGFEVARKIGPLIGASELGTESNECRRLDRPVIIKTASLGNYAVSATPASLLRVAAVVAALEVRPFVYFVWELDLRWCPWGTSGSHHQVRIGRSVIRRHGRQLGTANLRTMAWESAEQHVPPEHPGAGSHKPGELVNDHPGARQTPSRP